MLPASFFDESQVTKQDIDSATLNLIKTRLSNASNDSLQKLVNILDEEGIRADITRRLSEKDIDNTLADSIKTVMESIRPLREAAQEKTNVGKEIVDLIDNQNQTKEKAIQQIKEAASETEGTLVEAFLRMKNPIEVQGDIVGNQGVTSLIADMEEGLGDGIIIRNADTGQGVADEFIVQSADQIITKQDAENLFNRVKQAEPTQVETPTIPDDVRQVQSKVERSIAGDSIDEAQEGLDEIMRREDLTPDQKADIADDLQRQAAERGADLSVSDDATQEATQSAVRTDMSSEAVSMQRAASTKKNRGFIETIRNSEETSPALREKLTGRTYEPLSNEEALRLADERIADDVDAAENFALEDPNPGAEHTAVAVRLIKRFQAEGNHERAARVADGVAERLTQSGRNIQAAKLYSNLSKEGLLIRARKIVKDTNEKKFRWENQDEGLSDEFTQRMEELVDARDNATTDFERAELDAEIGTLMESLKRVSLGDKIAMAQTEMLLLNPKTWVRNIVGNELFYRVERLNKYPATLIDWAKTRIAAAAGKDRPRTITFRQAKQGEYWRNFFRGAKMGWRGTVPPGTPTQFDLPSAPTFRSKKNPLYWGEKLLGAGLRGFDFAGYQRARNVTLGELGYLRAFNEGFQGDELGRKAVEFAEEADDNIVELAHKYGKYVTFQDDNVISKGLQGIKRTLNAGQGFGLGDIVIKFPRTPGALLMRGIEYSPAGFARSAYILSKSILKSGQKVDDREVILATSRAIVGTFGLTGMGYVLHDKGIITGQGEDDRDLQSLQRIHGTGQYRLNINALKRFVLSGFDEEAAKIQDNDTIISYDWAQPVALAVAAGANASEQIERGDFDVLGPATAVAESLEGGLKTLTEQPLVTGITRLFGYGDPVEGIKQTALGAPSSFTPTIARQINSWYDNTRRNAYSPDVIAQSLNWAKRSIPGVAQTLPPMINQWGEEAEKYQGSSNNLFNVFFNPAFVNEFEKTPEAALVFDLYERAGETKQIPRIAPREVTVAGEKRTLTPEEQNTFQEKIGTKTQEAFEAFADISCLWIYRTQKKQR